jgi:hypothetical protein
MYTILVIGYTNNDDSSISDDSPKIYSVPIYVFMVQTL